MFEFMFQFICFFEFDKLKSKNILSRNNINLINKPSYMIIDQKMINYLYTAVLATLIISTISTLNQTLILNNFNCKINYATINNTLSFKNCQPIDNSINSFYYTDWFNCVAKCCKLQPRIYPEFDQQSLNTCRQSNNNSNSQMTTVLKVIILVLSITLGITLIGFMVYKIKTECIFNETKRINNQRQFIRQNQISGINNTKWFEQKQNPTQSNLNRDESQDCAICLEENTTLVLTCSHRFHFKCLLNWFMKSRSCPLCKKNNLDKLRLQCSLCKNKYLLISARKAVKNIKQWSQFSGICPECTRQSTRQRSYSRETSFQKLIQPAKISNFVEVIDFD